jgi:hypothetical protein
LILAFGTTACGFSIWPGDDATEWRGLSSAVERPGTAVARTQEDWLQLWDLTGQPAPRELDVGAEVALAIFLGTRRSGGYQPRIVRITEDEAGRTVEWRELAPDKGAVVVQVITTPWLIAILPAGEGAIRFREVREAML